MRLDTKKPSICTQQPLLYSSGGIASLRTAFQYKSTLKACRRLDQLFLVVSLYVSVCRRMRAKATACYIASLFSPARPFPGVWNAAILLHCLHHSAAAAATAAAGVGAVRDVLVAGVSSMGKSSSGLKGLVHFVNCTILQRRAACVRSADAKISPRPRPRPVIRLLCIFPGDGMPISCRFCF